MTLTTEKRKYAINLDQAKSCPLLLHECRDYFKLMGGVLNTYMDTVAQIAHVHKTGQVGTKIPSTLNTVPISLSDVEACMPAGEDDVNWDYSKKECSSLCSSALETVFKADAEPNPSNSPKRKKLIANVMELGYKTQKRFINNFNYDWAALQHTGTPAAKKLRRLNNKMMKTERSLSAENVLPLSKAFKKKYNVRNLQAVPAVNSQDFVMPKETDYSEWTVTFARDKGNKGINMEDYNTNANLMDLDFTTVMTDATANNVVPGMASMLKIGGLVLMLVLALMMKY